jgi:probable F420-dependent oxidoreductase
MPLGAAAWFADELLPSLELWKIADAKGVDAVSVPEHVVMGENHSAHTKRYGRMRDVYSPRFEPIVLLTMIASMTQRIRLSTNILMPALRPATLLAKQIATLDILSKGRTEFGVGAGWQKFEFDAQAAPWERRYGLMIETIQACRALWTSAPAQFHGKHINFEGAYSLPFPAQKGSPPILFGIGSSDLSVERMAKFADGWSALDISLDVVSATLEKIKIRMRALGRDPSSFRLKMQPRPVMDGDEVDVDATVALMNKYAAIGCTDIEFVPFALCKGPDDFDHFVDKVIACRDKLNDATG